MLDFYTRPGGSLPYGKLANAAVRHTVRGDGERLGDLLLEQALAQGETSRATRGPRDRPPVVRNAVTAADWPHLWLRRDLPAKLRPPLSSRRAGGGDALPGDDRGETGRSTSPRNNDPPPHQVDSSSENLMEAAETGTVTQKGSLVLHISGTFWEMRAFFAGVRSYYGPLRRGDGVTGDLQGVLEEVHGRSLELVLPSSAHSPGHPELELDWRWDAGAGEGVEVVIRQVQDPSWPTFRLPAELEFRAPRGGLRRVERVVDGRSGGIGSPCRQRPTAVNFDPDGLIPGGDGDPNR